MGITLDEAITHAEEVADKQKREKQKWDKWLESDYDHRAMVEKVSCELCAEEHRQLAEWLKDYKRLLEQKQRKGHTPISRIGGYLDGYEKALEQEPRWIPVSEKLPEKSGNYWCTFRGTNLTGSDYYTTESDAKEIAKEIFDEPEKYVGWDSQKVVAWMPLPNPYVPDTNIGKMVENPTGAEGNDKE